MQNKHLKFWLFAFVWTLVAVSATAYYSGRAPNFYLGQAVFDGRQAMGSVLNAASADLRGVPHQADAANASAAETNATQFPDMTAIPATKAKAPEAETNPQTVAADLRGVPHQADAAKPAAKAPCSIGETPIMRAGKIIGCSVAQQISPAKSPKIKVVK